MRQNLRSSPPRSRGSALILVLLMIVLLATIAVSFLSTARVEQIATRNFTRQTAARGLADLATGEAMAKIAEGFTATNTGATTVTISQPGLIRSFEFTGGGPPTVKSSELFPTTNTTGTNFNINTNGIITGKTDETLEVPWQTITNTNGQIIGRITYYVDDEGTKLNLNRAMGTRDTLNASGRRPLDIGAMEDADTDEFEKIVAGKSSGTTNITSWVHFFRPEQAVGAKVLTDTNKTVGPFLSASVYTNPNAPTSKTPWGTERLHINELPITDASVDNIYQSLTGLDPANGNPATTALGRSGKGLSTIFGEGFAEKYRFTEEFSPDAALNGVRQIAANMLQMRTPGATDVSFWFTNKTPLLGTQNLDADGIPLDYFARVPGPYINEVGVSASLAIEKVAGNDPATGRPTRRLLILRIPISISVEVFNPYPESFRPGANAGIVFKIDSFTFDLTHVDNNTGQIRTYTYGPIGQRWGDVETWGMGFNYTNNTQAYNGWQTNAQARDRTKPAWAMTEGYFSAANPYFYQIGDISGSSKNQYFMFQSGAPNHWGLHAQAQVSILNQDYTITAIDNVKIGFQYIKLMRDRTDASSIFDYVLGKDMGVLDVPMNELRVELPARFNMGSFGVPPKATNDWEKWATGNGTYAGANKAMYLKWTPPFVPKVGPSPNTPPPTTAHRLNPLACTPAATAFHEKFREINYTTTSAGTTLLKSDYLVPWPASPAAGAQASGAASWTTNPADQTWINTTDTMASKGTNPFLPLLDTNSDPTKFNATGSQPSTSSNNFLPADPSRGDSIATAVWPSDADTDMRPPVLPTGTFISPSDLGLVPTSSRWRRLRMQVQPASESAAGLIPDWAMLEVISFGPQATNAGILDLIQPVNLNGKFHVPSGTAPAARDIGLKSLAQVLDSDPNKFADSMSSTNIVEIEEPTKFLGATDPNKNGAVIIATNIGAMIWSDSSEWADRRAALGFPEDAYLLGSEIMEIKGVADSVDATDYDNSSSHFKWNEGRASALLPAVDTRSSHFMIYSCAQTLDKQGEVQSEALTKTLVEVEQVKDPEAPDDPPTYRVKKLYTEPVRVE